MPPQQIWRSTQDLYKIKLAYIPASLWRDPVLSTLAEELWVVGRYWWDWVRVFQGIWTLVVDASVSGWASCPHASMGSTNWIQRLILKKKEKRHAYESEELEEGRGVDMTWIHCTHIWNFQRITDSFKLTLDLYHFFSEGSVKVRWIMHLSGIFRLSKCMLMWKVLKLLRCFPI